MIINDNITEHFKVSEVAYRRHGEVYLPGPHAYDMIRLNLTLIVEPMRKVWGSPISIVDGGGYDPLRDESGKWVSHRTSPTTQHHVGGALDIRIKGWDIYEARMWIENRLKELGIGGGLGIYPKDNFIHVDVRQQRARWEG